MLTLGRFSRVRELATKLMASPRVRFQKIYEEVAHRQYL